MATTQDIIAWLQERGITDISNIPPQFQAEFAQFMQGGVSEIPQGDFPGFTEVFGPPNTQPVSVSPPTGPTGSTVPTPPIITGPEVPSVPGGRSGQRGLFAKPGQAGDFGFPPEYQQQLEGILRFIRESQESRELATETALNQLLGTSEVRTNEFDPQLNPNAFAARQNFINTAGPGERQGGLQGLINDFFDQRRTDIDENLPLDPFTQEMVDRRQAIANSDILQQVQGGLGRVGAGLSQQGIQGGGATAGAGALIQGAGISARANSLQSILGQRDDVNLARQGERTGFLNQLTGAQAGLNTQIGSLASGIRAGTFTDPSLAVSSLGDLFSGYQAQQLGFAGLDLQREEGQRNNDLQLALQQSGVGNDIWDLIWGSASNASRTGGSDAWAVILDAIRQGGQIGGGFRL